MKAFEMIMFFYNKDEHYPISDRFIEQYQQLDDGYLDLAKKTGHCINKNLHEPNQKWHLFESWFLQTVAEKKTNSLDEILTITMCWIMLCLIMLSMILIWSI